MLEYYFYLLLSHSNKECSVIAVYLAEHWTVWQQYSTVSGNKLSVSDVLFDLLTSCAVFRTCLLIRSNKSNSSLCVSNCWPCPLFCFFQYSKFILSTSVPVAGCITQSKLNLFWQQKVVLGYWTSTTTFCHVIAVLL